MELGTGVWEPILEGENAMKRSRIPTESADQIKLVARARHFYPGTVIYAVPNGGARGAMEATKLKEEGVLAGIPDLVVAEARGGFFGLYLEMKRADAQSASVTQTAIIRRLNDKGYRAIVVFGVDHAWRIFETYMQAAPTIPK